MPRRSRVTAFSYGEDNSARALLHGSLDPCDAESLSRSIALFTAERSMRDVEHNAFSKVLSPTGGPIANAETSHDPAYAASEPTDHDLRPGRDGRPSDALGDHRRTGALALSDAKSLELIKEPRLSERIGNILKQTGRLDQVKTLSLRKPPIEKETTYREPAGIDVTVFPQWFVSEQSVSRQVSGGREVRRRRLVHWSALDTAGGRRKFQDDGAKPKKVEVTPIRFVGSCQDGHLQDVDWRWAVHQTVKCEEVMWLEEVGTTADPSDTSIVCDCGRSLSLRDAFAPGRLGICRGERPWLGDIDPNKCALPLRLLTRTATNAYFPQVATVISLPSSEDRLTELVRDHLSDLRTAQSPQDVATAKKLNERIRATLDGYSDDEIFSRLRQLVEGMTADTKEPAKIAEFDVFASGKATIGENSPESRLYARTLDRSAWDVNPQLDLSAIAHVVAVDRLREVSCLSALRASRPRRCQPTATSKTSRWRSTALRCREMRTGCLRSSSSAKAYSCISTRSAYAPGWKSRRCASGSTCSNADIANGLRRCRASERRFRADPMCCCIRCRIS